jgi:gliding motility-associated-like protein
MKKIVKKSLMMFFMLLIAAATYPQCFNADFSNGDFSGWQGSTGENSAGNYSNVVVGLNQGVTNSPPSDPGQQTIINQPGTDAHTGNLLSILPPGGTSCARLGNDLVSGVNPGWAERLYYTMFVTPANCIFTYQYAVVFEDPSHTFVQQPKFTIYVLDSSYQVTDPVCGIYEVTSQSGIPGFQNYTGGTTLVHWKDWTTVAIDLSAQIGHNVTIQFTTYDCQLGGHFGYAYISCNCGNIQLQQQCNGAVDILTAPSGFASYLWSTGGTAQTETINNPVNGDTITCECTSVQGCVLHLTIILDIEAVNFTLNSPSTCPGDATTITATPVIPGSIYSYVWSTGDTTASISVSPTSTTSYSVTGTATGGCSNFYTTTVTVYPIPVGSTSETQSTCAGSDGEITANMVVGTAPFQYVWNTVPQQYTQTATGLPAGSYITTVTDNNGCSSTVSGNITSNLNLNVTATSTEENCSQSNGTATAFATGATGNYSYTWSTMPVQHSQTATGLSANTYVVTVVDGICSGTASVTITTTPAVVATISNVTQIHCFGGSDGSITANGSGGIPGYTYAWNSNPPQYFATANNLPAGTYTVVVTDNVGCTGATSAVIIPPTPISSMVTHVDSALCFGQNQGSISISASGGTQPYSYSWNTSPPQSGPTANNLYAGTYTAIITDDNGCLDTISGTVYQPTQMITTVANANDSLQCFGDQNGSITLNLVGGSFPFSYLWSSGQTNLAIFNLPAGSYTCSVTDNNGCTTSHNVVVWQPSQLFVQVDSLNEECSGSCDGQATSAVTGGIVPYTYLWTGGSSNQTITGLCPGIYNLTITDANGCVRAASTSVGTSIIVDATFTMLPTGGYIPLNVDFTHLVSHSPLETYFWTFGDNGISSLENPTHLYVDAGTFTVCLKVTNGNCVDSTCLQISPEVPSQINLPNVFTPNGDGKNELFQADYKSIQSFDCVIFNRWGKKIFEWNDVSKGWDGKMSNGDNASDGTYFYIMSAKGIDNVEYEKHGTVTLLR